MCQESFDDVFDVLEELASVGEIDMVTITSISGHQYCVEPDCFVEDNLQVRSHSTLCLLLKLPASQVRIDLPQVESVTYQ